MASSVVVPQFVKVLTKDDCSSNEMCISSRFCDCFGHVVDDEVKLKIRNGYKISVVFDRDECVVLGMGNFLTDFGLRGGETLVFEYEDRKNFNVYIIGIDGVEIEYPSMVHASQNCNPRAVKIGGGGWKFVKSVICTEEIVDELVPPRSFLDKFGATMPTRFGYVLNDGSRLPGYYGRREGTLIGLSGICRTLGLEDLNSFDILVFTYDGLRSFTVSLFDGLCMEVMFDENVVASGELHERITRPAQFVIEVKPFHMLSYCHGVDICAEFRGVRGLWERRDQITVYKEDRSWVLEIRKRADWKRTTIHDGWVQFREDLDLKIGDKCVFKWTDRCWNKFTVRVVKAVEVVIID